MRSLFGAPAIAYDRVKGKGSLYGLNGSASVKDRTLTLTVTNPHLSEAHEAEIVVRGAAPGTVKAAQIAAPDVHAHNTFANPNAVVIKDAPAGAVKNGVLTYTFAPASVTRLQLALA